MGVGELHAASSMSTVSKIDQRGRESMMTFPDVLPPRDVADDSDGCTDHRSPDANLQVMLVML